MVKKKKTQKKGNVFEKRVDVVLKAHGLVARRYAECLQGDCYDGPWVEMNLEALRPSYEGASVYIGLNTLIALADLFGTTNVSTTAYNLSDDPERCENEAYIIAAGVQF